MPRPSLPQIFGGIAVAAGVFDVLAYRPFGSRMLGSWGQLFCMTLGVVLTTFLLESLLT